MGHASVAMTLYAGEIPLEQICTEFSMTFANKLMFWKPWKPARLRKSFGIWSGRWESKPTPNTAKSLNILIHSGRLPSTTVHNRRYSFNCLTLRLPHDVPVNLERCPGVGMSQLTLNDFGRSPTIEKERGVRVAECVETTSWNPERVEDRPQAVLHNFIRRRRPTVTGYK